MPIGSGKTTSPSRDSTVRTGLRSALQEANIPTLLLVLAQLTGQQRWLEEPFRPTRASGLDDHDSGGLPDDTREEIRSAALDAVSESRNGRADSGVPGPEQVAEMLAVSLGEAVPSEYGPLLSEEAGFVTRDVEISRRSKDALPRVLIVGAGVAGMCIAIQLERAGIPYQLLEKNRDVGGTWLENTYPGCGVDTPSHLYSFSFAPRADWSRYFAPAAELRTYLRQVAADHDLYGKIEFGHEVLRAEWDSERARWDARVRTPAGELTTVSAEILITAVGHFSRPNIPAIEGLDTFAGDVVHTARWSPEVDITGKRVAVVGSGASAVQLVPALTDRAERLFVFQRSPQWIIPHPNTGRDVSPSVRYLLANVPWYGSWYRLRQLWRFGDRLHPALQVDPTWPDAGFSVNRVNDKHRRALTAYIESQLDGRPDLIAASVPDYPAYGKRPLIDHGWYRTIRRSDVELVPRAVSSVRGNRVVTEDGEARSVDALVLATGFKTLEILGPTEIIGRSGASLRDTWGPDDARAYLGISVPDFPNFFMLFGPNTNAGHGGSAFLHTEFQTRYVMQVLASMIEHDLASVECRSDVHWRYNQELDSALAATVWAHPSVTNYYRNDSGRLVGLSPWRYVDYWRLLRHADLADYVARPKAAAVA